MKKRKKYANMSLFTSNKRLSNIHGNICEYTFKIIKITTTTTIII